MPREESRSRGAEEQGAEEAGAEASIFTFHVHVSARRPCLATYMRDQLERQLSERGGLAASTLRWMRPAAFPGDDGQGELWWTGKAYRCG